MKCWRLKKFFFVIFIGLIATTEGCRGGATEKESKNFFNVFLQLQNSSLNVITDNIFFTFMLSVLYRPLQNILVGYCYHVECFDQMTRLKRSVKPLNVVMVYVISCLKGSNFKRPNAVHCRIRNNKLFFVSFGYFYQLFYVPK